MSIHNDSVNEVQVHIVLVILHLQVCFPFVYLQNASFNPHSSPLYSVYRIDSILNRKYRVVRYVVLYHMKNPWLYTGLYLEPPNTGLRLVVKVGKVWPSDVWLSWNHRYKLGLMEE